MTVAQVVRTVGFGLRNVVGRAIFFNLYTEFETITVWPAERQLFGPAALSTTNFFAPPFATLC
jgi:hypothetical protein